MTARARKRPNGSYAFPFKGQWKPSNPDDINSGPKTVYEAKLDILNVSEAEEHKKDRQKYEKICKLAANGVAYISSEDKEWLEDKECWKIMVRWLRFVEMDKEEAEKSLLNLNP